MVQAHLANQGPRNCAGSQLWEIKLECGAISGSRAVPGGWIKLKSSIFGLMACMKEVLSQNWKKKKFQYSF
jgi:hypothetical protein